MSIFIPTSTIEYYNLPQREIQVTERYSSMGMRIFFGTLRTRIHSQMCLVLLLPQESCLGSESDLRQLGEGHSGCD